MTLSPNILHSVAFTISLASSVAAGGGSAMAFECTGLTLPSSVVICSDPDLIRLADARQQTFNEARGRVGEERYKQLWDDQREWVRSYATTCGVPQDRPPPMPVPTPIEECMRRAGEARISYLHAYGQNSTQIAPIQQIASFDCAKAITRSERAICTIPELAVADKEMGRKYISLRDILPLDQRAGLIDDQQQWLKTRDNDCGSATASADFNKCLLAETLYRRTFLSAPAKTTANGTRLVRVLLHEDRKGIFEITIIYPAAEGGSSEVASRFNQLSKYLMIETQKLERLYSPNVPSLLNTHFASYASEQLSDNVLSLFSHLRVIAVVPTAVLTAFPSFLTSNAGSQSSLVPYWEALDTHSPPFLRCAKQSSDQKPCGRAGQIPYGSTTQRWMLIQLKK